MNTRQNLYIGFLTFTLFNLSAYQFLTLSDYLSYNYLAFFFFFINQLFIIMNIFELITFYEERDTKPNIQKTIQLYSIGQVILITSINIIMIILGLNILYGIINIGTYYILLYIIYRISKHIVTNSKSQHIKRKTI